MGAPELIVLGLMAFNIAVHGLNHGETREYNVWIKLVDTALIIALLGWGGFF